MGGGEGGKAQLVNVRIQYKLVKDVGKMSNQV